jgi:hypothetical protein
VATCGGDNNGSYCKVSEIQITQQVNFYDENGHVISTVTVTTNLETISDSKTGAIVSANASATAVNVSGLAFNASQLATIGTTVGAIQQAGATMSLGPNPSQLLTAIAAKESTLGVKDPTNPMQLSKDSGTSPNRDISHNIQGALKVLHYFGDRYSFDPAKTYDKYNGVPDLAQRALNVEVFMRIYNGMVQSISAWSPKFPILP